MEKRKNSSPADEPKPLNRMVAASQIKVRCGAQPLCEFPDGVRTIIEPGTVFETSAERALALGPAVTPV